MIEISELVIPDSVESPNASDFLGMVDVRNAIAAESHGAERVEPAVELLPRFHSEAFQRLVCLIAKDGGRVVGRGLLMFSPDPDAPELSGAVNVLPEYRRQRIGTALLDAMTRRSRDEGKVTLQIPSFALPADTGPTLSPPSGFGAIPATDAAAEFATGNGYTLQQVMRTSKLDLPVDAALLNEQDAVAGKAAGNDYSTLHWVSMTPAGWRDDLAVLRTRMSTDTPTGGLAMTEDVWDAKRVEEYDAEMIESGQKVHLVAVRHDPTGRLVAFNEVSIPPAGRTSAYQLDTLVLREHRGHRLGMLAKVEGIRRVQAAAPHILDITTMNAEENEHMLRVNIELGFRPHSYLAWWRREL
jgi:GNAT superfamily N-acetyltransferase